MILVVDTSGKEVRLGLIRNNKNEDSMIEFEAGRSLDSLILQKIDELIGGATNELKGIVVNSGPGSFTGLRIGLSVANALAYSLDIPIVGISKTESWDELMQKGTKELEDQTRFVKPVLAEYGAEPNITKPKER